MKNKTSADVNGKVAKKAKPRLGRPKVGLGCKLIAVTIEKGLLKRADAFATKNQLKRSQMIAQGLLAVMGES